MTNNQTIIPPCFAVCNPHTIISYPRSNSMHLLQVTFYISMNQMSVEIEELCMKTKFRMHTSISLKTDDSQ